MRRAIIIGGTTWGALMALLTYLPSTNGYAVPSFSRQAGVTCAACHTVFPQLTDFGRDFKRNGYTMISNTKGQTNRLEIAPFPPISAMVQTSYTTIENTVPGTQNGNALLPDQLSLFYAGRISDNLGAFMQITYDGVDDHFTIDNVDVRYARRAGDDLRNVLLGFTLNNNPTVSDLWNSTPAWGYPFASSELAPSPSAATLIDGGLAQQVAGFGGYLSWKDMVYAEVTVYRSFQVGAESPPTTDTENLIKGVTPYWRIALSHQKGEHNLAIGTYGLRAQLHPGDGVSLDGETNRSLDLAVDGQYQWLHDTHTVTIHSTWIHEKQDWNAAFAANEASNPSDVLDTFRVDGIYYYDRMVGGSLGFFSTTGDGDPLLYPPGSIGGSRTGNPESRGFTAELAFVPWYNTRLSVLYTIYDRFNGGDTDYDGGGRDASDNNTLYLNAWLMF